jgi:hypothetical protein
MMPLVPLNANFALKILLPRTKTEKFRATNALLAGHPQKAVQNAVIVRLVRLSIK